MKKSRFIDGQWVRVNVVKAILKGTDVEVTFELSQKQYAHYQYLRGERVDESGLMDQIILGKMQALLEHFE